MPFPAGTALIERSDDQHSLPAVFDQFYRPESLLLLGLRKSELARMPLKLARQRLHGDMISLREKMFARETQPMLNFLIVDRKTDFHSSKRIVRAGGCGAGMGDKNYGGADE